MSSFNTPDESVQDTVAQLINQTRNTDVVYNDSSDDLTVGLSASRSADSLELIDTGTDPSADGEIRNNGGKLKVQTGGQVGQLAQKATLQPVERLTIHQTGSYF
mgnify:CR=1 FL=1